MRNIYKLPEPCLREPCEQVKTIDSYIRDLAADLLEILKELNTPTPCAYGIAAPQIKESVQLFVIYTPAIQITVINPVVTKTFGQHTWIESCLSLPGQLYKVRRPKLIKFQYLGLDGQIHAEKAHDDYAGVFEHEIQHLSGICIDAIGTPVSREAIFSH